MTPVTDTHDAPQSERDKWLCCGPTVRKDGLTYECSECGRDVRADFMRAGLAGLVQSWLPERAKK